jgi:hypothetical protein
LKLEISPPGLIRTIIAEDAPGQSIILTRTAEILAPGFSGNRLLEQTFAAIPVADISEVSFWMRHPDGGSAVAAFFAYSDSSSQEVLLSTDGNWNFFNITSSLAAGKSLTGFGVYGNSGALARFDDAVVNTASGVPEPGTWMLLSFGVGAIGLRKRWSR